MGCCPAESRDSGPVTETSTETRKDDNNIICDPAPDKHCKDTCSYPAPDNMQNGKYISIHCRKCETSTRMYMNPSQPEQKWLANNEGSGVS